MLPARPQVTDAIWDSNVGFVCDTHSTDARLSVASSVSEPHYAMSLVNSGRLPDLNGAPVASWVIARLAKLAARRFPYQQGQVIGSDGGNYWLRFIAFTAEFHPLGTLSVLGDENRVQLWAQISPTGDSKRVITAFTACLLAEPTDLRRCEITVACTDFADPDLWKRLPFVFGWDGQRFIARQAPEHAASVDDFE